MVMSFGRQIPNELPLAISKTFLNSLDDKLIHKYLKDSNTYIRVLIDYKTVIRYVNRAE